MLKIKTFATLILLFPYVIIASDFSKRSEKCEVISNARQVCSVELKKIRTNDSTDPSVRETLVDQYKKCQKDFQNNCETHIVLIRVPRDKYILDCFKIQNIQSVCQADDKSVCLQTFSIKCRNISNFDDYKTVLKRFVH